jgi:hypothetical protein
MTEGWERSSIEELTERAVAAIRTAAPRVRDWIVRLRPADGTPGRFRWAIETTREANVAASGNILASLRPMGLWDSIVTPEDVEAGLAWIRGMRIGNEQYRDPALLDRKPPDWPATEPWPSPAILNVNNSYARNVLRQYLGERGDSIPSETPPPGWPQLETAHTALAWVKSRPWAEDPWGAGSHSMRMARMLLVWHKEGKIGIEPLIEVLRFFYESQDPETGLWGAPETPRNVRLNGAFKLFVLTRAQLDLPLPYADKIMDQVFLEFYRPDYDEGVGGCDEWDKWYVLAMARTQAPGYREAEMRTMAAWRILRDLEVFGRADGGLASMPRGCMTHWCGIDMAPDVPQGDAMGPGVIVSSIRACVDVLGIRERVPWKNPTPLQPANLESASLRGEILSRLGF